jgi:DNA-directed RNA polymerase alpha subunit
MTSFDNLAAERIGGATMKMKQHDQRESDLPVQLSEPARRALVGAGYIRLQQLIQLSEAEVKQLHGVGPKALDQLRRALEALGLSFAGGK